MVTRAEALNAVGIGWSNLIDILYDALPKDVEVMQVKEKFGTLRFYTFPTPEEYSDLIDKCELASEHICEFCGGPGKLRNTSWMKTLCDECYNDYLAYLEIPEPKE